MTLKTSGYARGPLSMKTTSHLTSGATLLLYRSSNPLSKISSHRSHSWEWVDPFSPPSYPQKRSRSTPSQISDHSSQYHSNRSGWHLYEVLIAPDGPRHGAIVPPVGVEVFVHLPHPGNRASVFEVEVIQFEVPSSQLLGVDGRIFQLSLIFVVDSLLSIFSCVFGVFSLKM